MCATGNEEFRVSVTAIIPKRPSVSRIQWQCVQHPGHVVEVRNESGGGREGEEMREETRYENGGK
jgi:hypothetical protein